MADKQGKGRRRLPQWYSEKVNMAADVFAGNPDYVDNRRPHIDPRPNAGTGIQAQRIGKVSLTQPGLPLLDLDDGLGVAE